MHVSPLSNLVSSRATYALAESTPDGPGMWFQVAYVLVFLRIFDHGGQVFHHHGLTMAGFPAARKSFLSPPEAA